MLRRRIPTNKTSSGSAENEPLDLTLPKSRSSERRSDDWSFNTVKSVPSSHALMVELLQQHILLSIISQPEVKHIRDVERPQNREKPRTERVEHYERPGQKRRWEANARERSRVQHLGDMFERLKCALPIEVDVKISKLATLKIATAYIRYLSCILDSENIRHLMESEKCLMLRICEARSYPKKL